MRIYVASDFCVKQAVDRCGHRFDICMPDGHPVRHVYVDYHKREVFADWFAGHVASGASISDLLGHVDELGL